MQGNDLLAMDFNVRFMHLFFRIKEMLKYLLIKNCRKFAEENSKTKNNKMKF